MTKNHKAEAQKWLSYLREGGSEYSSCVCCLRREIEAGNLTLADIDTSEEELEKLRVKSCEIAARKWLSYLREGGSEYSSCVCCLRREIEAGNLTLADIGTSEEELESLKTKKEKERENGTEN